MQISKHPSRSLPANASEEYLRKEAKRFSKLHGINLAAAQRSLAHDYGHRNWAELITAVKTILRPARSRPATSESETAGAFQLQDGEWATILNLAGASLAEMPLAADQKEWLVNRQSFLDSPGVQQQFVAMHKERIVGYACVEHPPAWMRGKQGSAGEYRLFVVVAPAARKALGIRLLAKLGATLVGLGARRAWFQEYEADTGFIAFLEGKGFVRRAIFRIKDGTRIVRLSMDAPFEPLTRPGGTPTDQRADDLREEDPR